MKKIIKKIKAKFSIFDLLLAGSLVLLVGVFFFFFYRKSEYIKIRVKVTDQDVLYAGTLPKNFYANQFEVGDVEYDAIGRKIAEIVKIDSYNLNPSDRVVYLDLLVKSTYDSRTKTYSVRGNGIRYGSPMRFNLLKVTFDGYVTEFPNSMDAHHVQVGVKRVETIGRGLEPFIADAVHVGDTFYDSSGNVLVKVLSVENKPAERVIQDFSPQLYLRNDPLYRDIYITVEVKTKTVDGIVYLFDDLPLKIGESVPINLKDISVFPAITKFIE